MSVYDPLAPVRPTPEGTHTVNGIAMTAGRDYVHDVCTDLLDRHVPLGCDIETVGVNSLSFHIKVVTFGTPDTAVALDPRDNMQLAEIRRLVEHAPALIFHNATFDIPPMHRWGMITLDEIDKVHDTIVYARMASTLKLTPKDLTACAKRHLGLELDTENSIKRAFKAAGYRNESDGWAGMDIDSPIYLRGAMMDTAVTAALAPAVWRAAFEQLTQGHPFTEFGATPAEAERLIEREQTVNRVMLKRSARGLPVDLDFLDRHRDQHAANMLAIERDLQAVGINPGNGNHLTKYLEAQGALPPDWPCTKTGQLSATAENLKTLGHPIAKQFVEHKQATKVEQYLGQVEKYAHMTGRVHPQCNVLGASATGRMSYGGGVPFQQFSAGARGIVVAEPDTSLVSIDLSSIEPIIMANAAADTPLIEAYEGGGDLYAPVVDLTGVSRPLAKVVLLAQMYGQGLDLLAANLGYVWQADQPSPRDRAGAIRDTVMGAMPAVRKYLDRLRNIGNQYGKIITVSGRVLDIPRDHKNPRKYAGYKAQNYWCQGSAYDVLAESIVELDRQGLGHVVFLAMHDELVVDGHPDEVRRVLETPPPALCRWADRTPMLRTDMADMGRHWQKV